MEGFQDTTATKKIFQLKKRIRAVCGGTSASKTISIMVWIIDYAQTKLNKKVDVFAESYPHLENGAIKDFKSIMMSQNYWEDKRWNESKKTYEFDTGTVVKFISVDKLGKAKGPRRDVGFVNEANHAMSWEVFDQLLVRTNEVMWLDWNPSNEFWYYEHIEGKREHDFLRLTYLDCLEVLPKSIVDDIEAHKDNKNWWKVYGLGELGEVEGKIYKDWQLLDEMPHNARLVCYGLDYGYSNDPTAIVAIYYYDGGYILDEVAFQKGLSNKMIADIISNYEKAPVIPDSAEPKSNDELKSYGLTIVPSEKGKDSVANGIQLVQDTRISVTKRSLNIIKEYRNYLWQVDKDGKILNVPEHIFSHSMDAIRYGLTYILKKPRVRIASQSTPVKPYYPDLGL